MSKTITISEKSKQKIIEAAHTINGVCDGAVTKDGCGFNGGDSQWFKFRLEWDRLSDSVVVEMYEKLNTYKRQLENHGINYENLAPEYISREQAIEEVKEKSSDIFVDPSWETVKLTFGKYNGYSIADIVRIDSGYLQFIAQNFNDGYYKMVAEKVMAGMPVHPQQKQREGSFITMELKGSEIIVKSSYDNKDKVKELSDRHWDGDRRVWITSLNIIDEIIAKIPEAELDNKIQEFLRKRNELKQKSKAMDTTTEFKLDGFGNGKQMMGFQKAGLEFLELAGGRAMIADDMGTGKTIQALSYLQYHKDDRMAIIVCPASLKLNWKREAEQWLTTNDTIEVIEGGKNYDISASIVIINYDILGKWEQKLLSYNPKIIIFDESHALKNQKAGRTQVAARVGNAIPKTIMLTGTPVLNRPIELFSQLNIINGDLYPEKSFFNYAKKYCGAKNNGYGWDFSGATNIEQLAQELKGIMIRRTKEQVLPELPEKRRSSIVLPMTNRKAYESQWIAFKEWIQTNRDRKDSNLEALPKLEYLKQMCVEGKINAAMNWIENFIESGEKLVIFANHKWTIDKLMEKFGDMAVKVDGSVTQAKRQEAVDRFQNDSSVRLFVGNIRAAGVGLTLTAASNVAFLELDWTPGIMTQAEDRCHRIGQKNSVNCWYLLAERSIDVTMMQMIENKRNVVDGVMDNNTQIHFNILENFFGIGPVTV